MVFHGHMNTHSSTQKRQHNETAPTLGGTGKRRLATGVGLPLFMQAKPRASAAGATLQHQSAYVSAPEANDVCETCTSGKPLQTKLTIGASDDPLELEADRVAEQVLAASAPTAAGSAPMRIQRFTRSPRGETSAAPDSVDLALSGSGRPLEPALQQDMQQRFGHDFSQVRVHTHGVAEQSARDVNANAYTVGHDIVFGEGRFAPETHEGQRLIAHELTHVVQQSGADGKGVGPSHLKGGLSPTVQRDSKTLDEELDEELKKHAENSPKSLDPKNPEYARTLQDYGHKLTHKSMTELLPEPTDKKAKAEWKKKFAKSELLASRILSQSGPKVDQKEERAQLLASDLAKVGLVDEAMALARQITDADIRKFVYAAAMDQPDKIKPAQIAEISKFFVSRQVALTDHPVLKKLESEEGAYTKQLGPEKVNAGLAELVKAYDKDAKLPAKLARILFFDEKTRAGFSKWMIDQKRGALLRAVSEQAYFVEGAKIATTKGEVNPSAGTLAWAISNQQKVTVEDIVALTAAAALPVLRPTSFDVKILQTWLDANTEKIGQAIKKQHPGDPDAAEAMLRHITRAFMHHVDPNAEDVKPDKSGKVGHLQGGGPQKSQLKVDCDVLATYSVRLLVSSGFTPVGYMAILPTDKSRAAHAMALLQYGTAFRAISNVEARTLSATTKDEALKPLRDFGIEEAYDPAQPLSGFKIYYKDSDAKGTLPTEVLNNDASALSQSLSK